MKNFFLIFLVFSYLFILNSSEVYAKRYKTGQKIEGEFYLNSKFKITLPEGKWTIAEKYAYDNYLKIKVITLLRIEDKKAIESIEIAEMITAGIHEDLVNRAIIETMFKNKYDGCYERPEYTVLNFYKKGNTHNCFWVGHADVYKELNNPDDPSTRGVNSHFKKWLNENQILLPKVVLYSQHSYFSRLKMGKWFIVSYAIDPKILNAPQNKFIDELLSEYHKDNIRDYPEHEKIMKKWISISAQRHIEFENSISVLDRHRLDLDNYSPLKNINNDSSSIDIIKQLKKLNDLFESEILTKEEFEKAKKKVLN